MPSVERDDSRWTRPSQVPGYREAAAAGVLPEVPSGPPRILDGVTAHRAFRVFLAKGAFSVLVLLGALKVIDSQGSPGIWTSLLILCLGSVYLWLVLRWWARVGTRNIEELHEGYTTLVLEHGMFRPTTDRRWGRSGWRIPWDYSGVWVLDDEGRVLSEPDPDVEPPGFYPSPHRRGAAELWSGAAWTGQFSP